MKIIGITSCAAGIAHTYMAKEALEKEAKKRNFECHVETQGSIGVENELTKKDIEEADVLIIASDVFIEKSRFIGKKILEVTTNDAIKDASSVYDRLDEATTYYGKGEKTESGHELGTSSNFVIKHLMSGISDLIPMAIAAGLLLAIANIFAFKPDPLNPDQVIWVFYDTPFDQFMQAMFNLGKVGFTLMIPVFAAGVARSIGGKPAVAGAFMGAYIINDPTFLGTEAGAGFLGAILVGFVVGYTVLLLKKVKWPQVLKPVVAIMILPLVSTFVIFVLVYFVFGQPLAIFMASLYEFMNMITVKYAYAPIIYGLILGGCMGSDLGGPINKTALLVAQAIFIDTMTMYGPEGVNAIPQAATTAAISVAPLAAGLSTIFAKKYYTTEERTMGSAAIVMGMVGITEGAIPFAARRPKFIIANVIASALAGGLVAGFGLQFYGGIGSPLGAIVGYVTSENGQIFAMLIWALSIVFAAFVGMCLYILLLRREKPVNETMEAL